jgi:hypothetical protein
MQRRPILGASGLLNRGYYSCKARRSVFERRKDASKMLIRFAICPFVVLDPFDLFHTTFLRSELA